MVLCLHKWSNVKRWQDAKQGLYFVIQRCRRCNEWIRKTFDLKTNDMKIVTHNYSDRVEKIDNGMRQGDVENANNPQIVESDYSKADNKDETGI